MYLPKPARNKLARCCSFPLERRPPGQTSESLELVGGFNLCQRTYSSPPPFTNSQKKHLLSFSPRKSAHQVVVFCDQTPPPKCVPFPSDNSGVLFMSSGGVILDLALQHQPIRTMSKGGIPPDLMSVVLKLPFCGKKQQKFNVNHLTLAFQGIPGYPKIQTNPAKRILSSNLSLVMEVLSSGAAVAGEI